MMERTRRILKYVRIAWWVAWGVAAVLFCLMWAISYWRFSSINCRLSATRILMVDCVKGCMYLGTMLDTDTDWDVTIEPLSGNVLAINKEVQSGDVTETIEVVVPIDWEHDLREEMNWQGRFGFGVSHSPDVQFVSFPNWFLALLSTALGVAPSITTFKRFSLRTLLIATTLVAVVLGFVVYVLK